MCLDVREKNQKMLCEKDPSIWICCVRNHDHKKTLKITIVPLLHPVPNTFQVIVGRLGQLLGTVAGHIGGRGGPALPNSAHFVVHAARYLHIQGYIFSTLFSVIWIRIRIPGHKIKKKT